MHIHRLFISALSLHRYPKESESKILTSTTNYLFLSPPKGFAHTIGISINLHIALKNSSIWIGSMGRCETTTYDDDECTKKATFSFLPPISIVSSPTWPADQHRPHHEHNCTNNKQQVLGRGIEQPEKHAAFSLLPISIYFWDFLKHHENPEIQKQITFCAFLRTTQFYSHAIYESEVHAILVHNFFRGTYIAHMLHCYIAHMLQDPLSLRGNEMIFWPRSISSHLTIWSCQTYSLNMCTTRLHAMELWTTNQNITCAHTYLLFYELIVCRCWCAKHDSYIHNTKCEARHTLKGIWWFYFP